MDPYSPTGWRSEATPVGTEDLEQHLSPAHAHPHPHPHPPLMQGVNTPTPASPFHDQAHPHSPVGAGPASQAYPGGYIPLNPPPPPAHLIVDYNAANGVTTLQGNVPIPTSPGYDHLVRSPSHEAPIGLRHDRHVSKRFQVNYQGVVEGFRVSSREEDSQLLRETIAAAFSLPTGLFRLKDDEGCNVVVSFTSITDCATYALTLAGGVPGATPATNPSLITTVRRVAPDALSNALQAGQTAKSLDYSALKDVSSIPRVNSVISRTSMKDHYGVRAVLIGVDYSRRGHAEYDLSKTRVFSNGVKKMRTFLESKYSDCVIMEALEEAEDGGVLLTGNGSGTRRDGIMRWAEWLVESPAALNVFYFIGHAALMSCGGKEEEVLLPSDFSTTPDNFNVVSLSDLLDVFKKVAPEKKVSVVLDCSYTASHLTLPCRIRLFKSGEAEMIETQTDQDSALLSAAASVSVLTTSSQIAGRTATVESVLTEALCDVLSRDGGGAGGGGGGGALTNEAALIGIATHIRQYHPAACVTPVVLSTKVLDFGGQFCL